MKRPVKNVIRVIQIGVLCFLGYHIFLLYHKTDKEIEDEYKDSKLFIFLLFAGFVSTLYAVFRTNADLFRKG